jgi:hypothetical protein
VAVSVYNSEPLLDFGGKWQYCPRKCQEGLVETKDWQVSGTYTGHPRFEKEIACEYQSVKRLFGESHEAQIQ